MAKVVAGLLASALVGIAKDKLLSAIAGQASLLWNFTDDLEEMKADLETISAVLVDAERQSTEKEVVRLWLMRLRDAALDISDMLEDYQDTSDQAKAKMPGVLSCLPMQHKKIAVANRMKSLSEKLRKIEKEISNFDFKKGSNTNNEKTYDERETTSYFPEEPVGRDGEKQEIINLLSANTSNDDEMVIVAIYGLGGMGKSTLAQLVYNDAQFKKYDYRIWVYVSQVFNLNKIESSIISQLPTQEAQQNMGTQQVMKQRLDKLLDGKKVLVVLDDLWEENMIELGKLRKMLHVKGSKVDVIVTTRKKEIAMGVSTSKTYNLQSLKDDKCWEIIKRSSEFELKSNQEKLEEVGLDIAKKCGGVALAAQVVGFMLRSIDDLSGWTEINNSDIWNRSSEASDVLPSLKLSYKRMPPQLRLCFSYCAIFPKGHNIVEDDLIQQWIALDFIEQSKGKECINKLLGMSFLQVSKLSLTSQKDVVRYTMHDLVHDLATLTVADELIVFNAAPQKSTLDHKYCHYSLLRKYDRTTKLANMPSKLRALRFSVSGELDIPSGAFSFAKCLRTLDFSECSGIMLPASIGRLKQLRCLIAPRMRNESLPECITELPKLQYLNINGSSQISALPESIGKLGCLKYLCLSGCSGISKLPESFGHIKSMIHIDMSECYGIRELPESISELSKLQYLNINGSSKITVLPESIGNLGCLKYLCLCGCSGISELPESFGHLKSMVHLDMSGCCQIGELPKSISELSKLQYLNTNGCFLMYMLPYSRKSFANLKCMVHLDMSDYVFLIHKQLVDSLCNLTQLQYLNISSSLLEGLPEGIGSLVNLRHLNMSNSEALRKLPDSLMKLQSLLHLNLSGCKSLQRGTLACLQGLTALQHLDISHLEVLVQDKVSLDDFIASLTNLEHLDLSSNITLAYLPESICNLKRLHTLDLSFCIRLRSLPESIGTLGLKSLVLEGCTLALMDHASSLVNCSQTLPDFKIRADDAKVCSNLHLLEGIDVNELRIRSLENVMSLEEASKVKLSDKHNLSKLTLTWSSMHAVKSLEDKGLLEQLVPPTGLKSLLLKGYSSTSFPGWLMDISRHLTNLVSIELHDLETCSKLPTLGQLPHLEYLELSYLPGIRRIDREFCGGKGAFRRLSSFYLRHMEGLEEWNTTYSVGDGVEEFMFPVLDRLKIEFCRRLRLKPCPPTFRECIIEYSDQVISSLEEADKTSHHCSSSSPAIKLDLQLSDYARQDQMSIRLFHHFPLLQELSIYGYKLTSLPESMRHLTSLESLTLNTCDGISALPEWLGDLSSLKGLDIRHCRGIKSLPACIQQLTKLQTLEILDNQELKEWCESEENKTKLAHISNVRFPRF